MSDYEFKPHWAGCSSCDLCETPVHSDICHLNLCEPCVGENVSNESTDIREVPFKKQGTNPECLEHSSKICELHWEQCDCPICALGVSTFDHEQHLISQFLLIVEKKAA